MDEDFLRGRKSVVDYDIVERLREEALRPAMRDVCNAAADEIERLKQKERGMRMCLEQDECEIEILRTALVLAAGELSTHEPYNELSPAFLVNKLMKDARQDISLRSLLVSMDERYPIYPTESHPSSPPKSPPD